MTQDEAIAIMKSGANVFLTGEPGSGKSYVVSRFVAYLRGQGTAVSVTASTGIAAAQIGGTTIHAWSGLGARSQLSSSDLDAINKNRRTAERIKKAKVLIVDEISMLSGQTLSAVASACQFVRKSNVPFGGLQVVVVGDFFQLPPVVRREEMAGPETDSQDGADASPFAYASRCWRDADFSVCYLTEQHRQTDRSFSLLLGGIRASKPDKTGLDLLASRKIVPASMPADVTRLFTHNMDVDRINAGELDKLKGVPRSFYMTAMGDKLLSEGLKRGCLSPERLDLKMGANVMFTKNDADGRFVNGTLGVVTGFDDAEGHPVVETRSGSTITARPAEWKVSEDETVKAGIAQIPLRLAWAITVHKSQGMSLDAAVMDLSNAFEYGQGYVALSRVRSLKGLHLLGWNERALRVHPEALAKDDVFRKASELERERLRSKPQPPDGISASRTPSPPPPQSSAELLTVARAGTRWTPEEDIDLSSRYRSGESIKAIAETLGRQQGAIRARLVKQGLVLK